jgi:hypothetical protein
MDYNVEVFSRQYPVVVFFVQRLAYFRGLKAAWDGITDHKEFWASTVDGHLKLATVAWCNVFGAYKEETHWTKIPSSTIDKQARQDFCHKVLSKTGLTQEQWKTYHQEMLDFRNRYVAHLDVRVPFNDPVPLFDHALQVAYAYEEWARELTKSVIWNQPTLSSLYEQCESEASSIMSQ